jgi:flagellar motor switch protein FliN/FliY
MADEATAKKEEEQVEQGEQSEQNVASETAPQGENEAVESAPEENVESFENETLKKETKNLKGSQNLQSLDFILDIPLKVTVELGRTKMNIKEILQLSQGSVVELSKFAGEPLEILVNEKLIARGEVVVVNEKFGIRLTDIISPAERIEQLG